MLLQSHDFRIKQFHIPALELRKGEMCRFWVQLLPMSTDEKDQYWGINEMKKAISKLNEKNMSLRLCPNRISRPFWDILRPKRVGQYLKSEYGLLNEEILNLVSQFNIKPEYRIKDLGYGHQKVFSIICNFLKYDIVAFDYYGLDPSGVDRLTKFVKSELIKGKSAISFDNLQYIPDNPDTEMIVNLQILQN